MLRETYCLANWDDEIGSSFYVERTFFHFFFVQSKNLKQFPIDRPY